MLLCYGSVFTCILCAVGGGAQPIIEPKSSGRTFEKLCDIRKYANPDFLAEAQCNLAGRTIERVRYTIRTETLMISIYYYYMFYHYTQLLYTINPSIVY